ncbi:MAG: coproporphyrinogen dehydrogenase HemZ [Defluviitaleaceae bacterium]|nr:coproporphyrinogen dehydrogenase HemZ [Defluviitaleaceae bacterium]
MITCICRHGYINEVQVTAQVFFPNEKFAFAEEITNDGYTVVSHLENATIYKNGTEVSRFSFTGEARSLNPRRVVMLSIYHALQKAVPTIAPWGALTGIRPSKLVREWMDNSYTDTEILNELSNPYNVSAEKAALALQVAKSEKQTEKKIRDTVGIYISVPFCPSRCIYCSFNISQKPASDKFITEYVDTLITEIKEKAPIPENVSSIYIGGGTPTFLNENLLERLLYAACNAFFKIIRTCEFTVEAGRPDTITAEKLRLLRKYGVNRLAINPQTLNDTTLQAIGRNHTAADFFTAFNLAREIGFECINADIIAGLPGESPDDMHRNMEALAKLTPENITIHTLSVKRASRLNEQGVGACAGQDIETMLSAASAACADMGLNPYYLYRQKNTVGLLENVGYSLPTHECLYNVGMMAEVQSIIGLGAGAVTKNVVGSHITRKFNPKNPDVYISRRKR